MVPHSHHVFAEGAVEALVLLVAVPHPRKVGREHVRAARTLGKMKCCYRQNDCCHIKSYSCERRAWRHRAPPFPFRSWGTIQCNLSFGMKTFLRLETPYKK